MCIGSWKSNKGGKYVNMKNNKYFPNRSGETEGKRQRSDNKPKKYAITTLFLLSWLEILIIQGEKFRSTNQGRKL